MSSEQSNITCQKSRKFKARYFRSRKNYYARSGAVVVRLHADGYFRSEKHLPTQILEPVGPGKIVPDDKNEIRRGLFLPPVTK